MSLIVSIGCVTIITGRCVGEDSDQISTGSMSPDSRTPASAGRCGGYMPFSVTSS
jgi:hypothetical protein